MCIGIVLKCVSRVGSPMEAGGWTSYYSLFLTSSLDLKFFKTRALIAFWFCCVCVIAGGVLFCFAILGISLGLHVPEEGIIPPAPQPSPWLFLSSNKSSFQDREKLGPSALPIVPTLWHTPRGLEKEDSALHGR